MLEDKKNKMSNLRKIRKLAGLTQRECAERVGINIRLLQKYEAGETAIDNMTVSTAKKMSAAIGHPIEDLENINFDVFSSDTDLSIFSLPEIVGMAKISAVRKESKIGAFGDTFSANLSRVPDSCFERLTVSDLARLIDAIYDAYSDGNKI